MLDNLWITMKNIYVSKVSYRNYGVVNSRVHLNYLYYTEKIEKRHSTIILISKGYFRYREPHSKFLHDQTNFCHRVMRVKAAVGYSRQSV